MGNKIIPMIEPPIVTVETLFKQYSPWKLTYNHGNPVLDWELDFQLYPIPQIIFKGNRVPELLEIINVLAPVPNMPMNLAPVIQVICGHLLLQRELNLSAGKTIN